MDYERKAILEFLGSRQAQSGIIWGDKQPGFVAVTSGGRHGKKVGYGDRELPDGTWLYHGQGESGDQDPERFSNSLLVQGDRSVLLFSTREPTAAEVRSRNHYAKLYRFEGCYRVACWEYNFSTRGRRAGDRLLVFRLVKESPNAQEVKFADNDGLDIATLRQSLTTEEFRPAKTLTSTGSYFERSAKVQLYVKARAVGRCEWCKNQAPFLDGNGRPFLESHHILRLADGGPDHPSTVAALCPNCHREAHYGQNAEKMNTSLLAMIREKESANGIMSLGGGHLQPVQ